MHEKWKSNNTEKIKNYRAVNAKKANACSAKWREDNPERAKAAVSKWKALHLEKRKIYNQNRRARKLEAGGKLSHGLSIHLFKLQKGKCPCCGKPLGDNYHMDHIMPIALGGTNTDDNIQLLRQRCNNQKKDKHPIEFMQLRGFLI
jgi:5-methylcytosine-specific restriction endonuclease McrA